MRKILFSLATFGLLSEAFGAKRFLDSTLFVAKDELKVTPGVVPLNFKCGTEWAAIFTDNGQTITLKTLDGSWTLTGLSSEVASAAVSEGAPLVSAIAGGLGVEDVDGVTSSTLDMASQLASVIGSSFFDAALSTAVDTANDILDGSNIHPSDFNQEILDAIPLLGPSGTVVDASDTTVDDVHREATKTIGLVLSALASTGVISLPQIPELPADLPINLPADIPKDIPADLGGYSIPADIPTNIPTDISNDVPTDIPADLGDYSLSTEDTSVPTEDVSVPEDVSADVVVSEEETPKDNLGDYSLPTEDTSLPAEDVSVPSEEEVSVSTEDYPVSKDDIPAVAADIAFSGDADVLASAAVLKDNYNQNY